MKPKIGNPRRWLGRCFSVVAVLACAMTASVGVSGAATSSAVIHRGGTATFTIAGFYATLDPAIANPALFTGVETMEAIFGPGLDYVNPTTGAIEMGFATGFTSSSGGKVW